MAETNEIMVNEEMNVEEPNVAESSDSSVGTGVSMLIGSALTLAAIGGVKLGKKAYKKLKIKMADRKEKAEEDSDVIDVTDESTVVEEENLEEK